MNKKKTIDFISGPCSFESKAQIEEHFKQFPSHTWLRAGVFKLRTNPQSFQGLREDAIDDLKELKERFKFKLVTEVVSNHSVDLLNDITDVFQVGTRNMYNYELLKYLNNFKQPVLLKRGFSASLNELINAAKYIDDSEARVILCERGIRTFETSYRNTLDLNAVSYLKRNTNYKVIVDPSHGTGKTELVSDLAKASIVAGADGLLIETHPNPSQALSDADQAINHQETKELIKELNELSNFLKKDLIV